MLPLRSTDVREFALNTSITMNMSELENYMIDDIGNTSTMSRTMDQHPPIKEG